MPFNPGAADCASADTAAKAITNVIAADLTSTM